MPKTLNKKKMGLWLCISLVIGNMIGSGIFLLPASLAPYGGMSIIGWLASGFGALMTAMVFRRLSKAHPKQGGPYAYVTKEFGQLPGFIVAWGYWVSLWAGNAAIAVAMVTYASYFFPTLAIIPFTGMFVAIAAIMVLTAVNIHGIFTAAKLQLLTTILKITPLLILAVTCFFVFDIETFKPVNPSPMSFVDALATTAALTLWAFLGLEAATVPADSVEQPNKTIPRATIIGFTVTGIIYILSTTTILSVIPNDLLAHSKAPFADAASILWGSWAGHIVAVGAIISCFGALNGWILVQGQVAYSVAKDGLFPKPLASLNMNGVPAFATILSSLFVILITIANFSKSLVSMFTFAILLSTLAVLIPYLFCALVDLKLQLKSPSSPRKWFAVLSSSFAILFSLWAIYGIGAEALLWGAALLGLGIPLYYSQIRNKSRQSKSKQTS
jgi:basic amino acid/polyamine antiporter, APA family